MSYICTQLWICSAIQKVYLVMMLHHSECIIWLQFVKRKACIIRRKTYLSLSILYCWGTETFFLVCNWYFHENEINVLYFLKFWCVVSGWEWMGNITAVCLGQSSYLFLPYCRQIPIFKHVIRSVRLILFEDLVISMVVDLTRNVP